MKRYLVWAVVVLLAAGFAAVMIPGSPLSLQNTVGEPVSEDWPDGMEETAENLAKKHPTRPLSAWVGDLSSPDKAKRMKAIKAINRIAPLSGRAAEPVANVMLNDPETELRELASRTLSRMGAGAKPAINQGITALAADNPVVRRNAITLMMTMKADARPAVPALVAAMNDPRNEETLGYTQSGQVMAAAALGAASAGSAEAVSALTAVVESTRPNDLRQAAARSLGVIGPAAKPAVPALTAALKTTDLDLKEDVTNTLRVLGENPPDVVRPKTSASTYSSGVAGSGSQYATPKKEDESADKKGVTPKKADTPPTSKGK